MLFYTLGKLRDGWSFKQFADRQLNFKNFADAGEKLRSCQGMAAKLGKEIVMDSDFGQSKHFAPDGSQFFLYRGARSNIGGGEIGTGLSRLRQGLLVDFAV